MKIPDSSERIAIHIRNYIKGTGLLVSAVESLKRMKKSIERNFAFRVISQALTDVQFIDELRELETDERSKISHDDEYDDEGGGFIIGEVKHSIIQVKLSRDQMFEADWEAHKIGPQTPQARIDIILKKIEQGPSRWNEVIDDIAFLTDPNDRLMLLCELTEAALKRQHTDSARFFKLVHDAVKHVVVPDDWSSDPAPITHPLFPLASLYGTANRHEDCIELYKKLSQPARDVLIVNAISVWLWGSMDTGGMDTRRLLAFVDEIQHRLEKATALCDIAYSQIIDHTDGARETLHHSEQLLDESCDDLELFNSQRSMVAGEIMKIKLRLGDEESVDIGSMNEEEEMISNTLDLELTIVDKALEKGHVRKAKRLADQIMDDSQQAIAYGWIAYKHIKRAQANRAQHLLAQELSPHKRMRPIAELMWQLSRNETGHLFYGHAGTFISLAIKTAIEDLKDRMDDELRQDYIRILTYAGGRLATDAKNGLATSDPERRSNQLQTEFAKVLQTRHTRYLPKLALLLTSEDKRSILDACNDRAQRNMAEAAILATEL